MNYRIIVLMAVGITLLVLFITFLWKPLIKRRVAAMTRSTDDRAVLWNTATQTIDYQPMNRMGAGIVIRHMSNVIPTGFLYCDGRTLRESDFPELFKVIGTRFGTDGVGTFKIPQLRDSFPMDESVGSGRTIADLIPLAFIISTGRDNVGETIAPPKVTLYTDPWMKGSSAQVSVSDGVVNVQHNDQYSSISVPLGLTATAYRDGDARGDSFTTNKSMPFLYYNAGSQFEDNISSVRVVKNN